MAKERRKHSARRFSKRDQEVVDLVVLYGLATDEVLSRVLFEGKEPSAVLKVTNRLCEENWLTKFPLLYPTQYILPGKRAAKAYGFSLSRTLPLGPQSLPTKYAVLLYATTSQGVSRLSDADIATAYPWYDQQWLYTPHCKRNLKDTSVLEILRIDLGGPADHVARKCNADVKLRIVAPEFEELVSQQSVRLVVVTATTQKAAAIQVSLRGHLWPDGLGFHLAVIPELLPLLPRCVDET